MSTCNSLGGEHQRQTFCRSVTGASEARRLVEEFLTDNVGSIDPAAVLLASELVTNAIVHTTGSRCDLDLSYQEGRVRVAVSDQTRPLLSTPPPQWDRGRGLLLVDRLAESWGVEHPTATGKCVWFELDELRPN